MTSTRKVTTRKSDNTDAQAVFFAAISEIEEKAKGLSGKSKENDLFASQAQLTLRQIADIFSESNPEARGLSYVSSFFLPLILSKLTPEEALTRRLPMNIGIYRLLAASLLYCKFAVINYNARKTDMGWTLLTEASFWCGCASVADKLFDTSKISAIAAKREGEISRKLGLHKLTGKKTQKVGQLLKQLMPPDKWKTYSQAAQTIHAEVTKEKPKCKIEGEQQGGQDNSTNIFENLSKDVRGVRTIMKHIVSAIEFQPDLRELIKQTKKPGPPKKSR